MKSSRFAALGLAALASVSISAQRRNVPPDRTPAARAPAPARTERAVPFKVGETLTYDISWSAYVTAGTAVATVKEKRPSYNSTAYYVVAEGRPTPLLSKLYSIYYKMDSLIDAYTLLPQRGSIYSEEGSRHRFRTTLFDRRTNMAHFEYKVEGTATADFGVSPVAQDALSAIYVLRAVPFKSGERITMPICDNGINYKLQIDITGPERVQSGLGAVDALRLNLTLFDARNQRVGRNTAMWMSDDPRRLPVRVRADLPVGSFNLVLREAR
jgi:hypothetical protein